MIERSIRNMQNEMLKLNMLITKERGMSEDLQQNNVLQENEFMIGLRVCGPLYIGLGVYFAWF